MKTVKLALVVIPSHWDAADLCHPSVNEQGRVMASADVGLVAPEDARYLVTMSQSLLQGFTEEMPH